MSRMSRRLKKRRQSQKAVQKTATSKQRAQAELAGNVSDSRTEELKQKMAECEKSMKFADAINTLAELIQAGCRETEVIYHGALDYYRIGDYDRAAKWAGMTLDFDSQHLGARILIGRLCFLKDRIDDGLSVFEHILALSADRLTEEQKEDMHQALAYYGKHQADRLKAHYPHILPFLSAWKLSETPVAAEPEKAAAATGNEVVAPAAAEKDPLSALKALKSRLTHLQEETSEVGRAEEKPFADEPADTAKSEEKPFADEPADTVKPEEKPFADEPADTVEPEEKPFVDELADTLKAEEKPFADEPEEAEESPDGQRAEPKKPFSAMAVRDQIMSKEISLIEKIRLLNQFAGCCFYGDDFAGAQLLLEEALSLDAHDAMTLRNAALNAGAAGQQEQALAFASRMSETDFSLLAQLKQHRK